MPLNINDSKKSSVKLKLFIWALPIFTSMANIGIKVDFNVRVEKKFETHISTTPHINDSLNELKSYSFEITTKGKALFHGAKRNE